MIGVIIAVLVLVVLLVMRVETNRLSIIRVPDKNVREMGIVPEIPTILERLLVVVVVSVLESPYKGFILLIALTLT